jgi:signal transduction histidine kinase
LIQESSHPAAARSAADPSASSAADRTLSLERKLPYLMIGLLVLVLASSLVITYLTLSRGAEQMAMTRLDEIGQQLVDGSVTSTAARLRQMGAAAANPAILGVARAADTTLAATPLASDVAAATLVLKGLMAPIDSGMPVELLAPDGRRLIHLGNQVLAPTSDAPASVSLGTDGTSSGVNGVNAAGVNGAAGSATASNAGGPELTGRAPRISRLYPAQGRVVSWITVPVIEHGRVIGYIAYQRRMGSTSTAQQAIRKVSGEDVALYVRNDSGSFWASLTGGKAGPPNSRTPHDSGFTYERDSLGTVLAVEKPLKGTPWVLVLEVPERFVLARPRNMVTTLGITFLALTVVGAIGSWFVSRRITRPLVVLTSAAEAIARGDYARRVPDEAAPGTDEVARLARSFNQMAAEVEASRRELEQQVQLAQEATRELERTNERLSEAANDAGEARDAAEHANRAKSDFLAVMSHELRTPLNAIGGYAQLLELEIHGPVNESQRDALGRITRSQHLLLRLVNDLLNFAKLEAGHIHFELSDVRIHDVLLSIEPLVAPQVRAKGLHYEYRPCDPAMRVRADLEKLEQVLLNLLSNAIKFTPAGGRISLECLCADGNGCDAGTPDVAPGTVEIRVRDTGVGIPPDRLRSVFEPFVQGDRALNNPQDGVGLGLAISRDLAHGMGGTLSAQSEVGEGSMFMLTLKMADEVSVEPRVLGVARGMATASVERAV